MIIRKVLHLADLHLRTYKLHDEYKDVFNRLLTQITNLVKNYNREEIRIVIAGDIVHQKTIISNEQLILCTWFLKKLEEIAPIIIIAGNHDLNVNNKDRLDSITPMVNFLPEANINYFKESKCYLDNNIVWCVYSIFEENSRPNIEAAKIEFGNDKKYIGLFHGPLIGAKTDIGYTIDHGAELQQFAGLDAVMCGDIHQYQKLMLGDIKIIMPSSLVQQNFGESVSKHGFVVWNMDDMGHDFHEVENKYPLYQFKITSLDDIDNNKEKIINL